jgi:excisionase family DNA binding protein
MERIATTSSSQDRTALEGLLTVGGVCELLNVSRQTLYRVIRAGELIPIRVSKSPRFAPDEVRRYLERHREVSLR